MPSAAIIPNAIRLSPGVVKTELASASCGPAAILSASSCSVAPSAAGNSAAAGSDAFLTLSRTPFSLGTFWTASDGVVGFFLPPHAATRSDEAHGEDGCGAQHQPG